MSDDKLIKLREQLAKMKTIRSPDQEAFHASFLTAATTYNEPPTQEEFNAIMLEMGATPDMIFQRRAPTEEDIKRFRGRYHNSKWVQKPVNLVDTKSF